MDDLPEQMVCTRRVFALVGHRKNLSSFISLDEMTGPNLNWEEVELESYDLGQLELSDDAVCFRIYERYVSEPFVVGIKEMRCEGPEIPGSSSPCFYVGAEVFSHSQVLDAIYTGQFEAIGLSDRNQVWAMERLLERLSRDFWYGDKLVRTRFGTWHVFDPMDNQIFDLAPA